LNSPTSPPATPLDWSALDITTLLGQWRSGDLPARDALVAALYPILRSQASARLRQVTPGELSISATDLAHEAYLRLIEQRAVYANRGHFLAIVAQTLRRVLTDLIRDRSAQKRGALAQKISLTQLNLDQLDQAPIDGPSPFEITHLLQALETLERREPIAAKVIELRFFGGLSIAESAEVLGIGTATANRHFALARAWLATRI
jgi:RNA polymerase sigma factor (TIGR02999 family)